MLIVCPACTSAYEIDAEKVGSTGRAVRCAACRETWFITPDDVAASQAPKGPVTQDDLDAMFAAMEGDTSSESDRGFDAVDEDAGVIVDQPAPYRTGDDTASRPVPKRRFHWPSPALAVGAVLFVILPLALLARGTVVRAMPQSAGVFASLGLPVNLRGIGFHDVVAFQLPIDGEKPARLVVEGDLVGLAADRATVPDLEVELRDAQNQPIYRWTIPSPRAALEKAETARFNASLSAPPAQARSILVRFADGTAARKLPETKEQAARDLQADTSAPLDATHAPPPHH